VRYPIPIMIKKLLNSARKTTDKLRKVVIGMLSYRSVVDVSREGSTEACLQFDAVIGVASRWRCDNATAAATPNSSFEIRLTG